MNVLITTVVVVFAATIFVLNSNEATATQPAETMESGSLKNEDAESKNAQHLIQNQLSRYQRAYPGIDFRLLSSPEDYAQLLPLEDVLGPGVTNLDYQHPEELRTTLVEAQEYRIGLMVENEMSSATLFHTPVEGTSGKQYICLITIAPSLLGNTSSHVASEYLYDLSRRTIESMPKALRFIHQDVLLYTLNHEVFHCIDAYLSGFIYAQTEDSLKASYDRRKAEIRADIFASISHLSRKPSDHRFLANLALARTIQLLHGDTEHYSSDVLNLIESDYQPPRESDIEFLVNSALTLFEASTISYEEHKELLTAMYVINQRFGIATTETSDNSPMAGEKPDPERVTALTDTINNAIKIVRGNQ